MVTVVLYFLGVVSLTLRELKYICDKNFKLKLSTCAQSIAFGTRTNFQIEMLIINVISGVVYFRENILGSSRSVSETVPGSQFISVRVTRARYPWTYDIISPWTRR